MKVLFLFAFLAVSGVMSQSAVTYSAAVGPVPSYGYAYDVHDPTTGDIKNHQEVRNGDAVSGSYSLVEADGTKRIVDYTADGEHGFNANVHHEAAGAAAVAPVVAKHVAPAYPYAYHAYPYAVKSAHHAYPSPPISGYSYPYVAGSGYAHPYAASSAHHAYPYASAAYAYPYAANSAHHAYPYASAAYAYPYASFPFTYPTDYFAYRHHQAVSPSAYPYVNATYAYAI